jgi:hypothetical protein
VWDLQTGQNTLLLGKEKSEVRGLALSGDGKRLISVSEDIKVWDLQTGKETLTLGEKMHGVQGVAFSADGKRLFAGNGDGTIDVWDLERGEKQRTLSGHTDTVFCLALSADGKRLFSGSLDTTIKVWDLQAGRETTTLTGHTGAVSSLALTADGKRLFSGSFDQTIKGWDLEKGKEITTLRGHSQFVVAVVLAGGGKRLISGSLDSTLKVWDVETGKDLLTLRGPPKGVWCLALSQDDKRLVCGGFDGTLMVWDLGGGATAEAPAAEDTADPCHPDNPRLPGWRAKSANNLKQLALGMHSFHDLYKGFPFAQSDGRHKQGRLSWRVALLPFLGETTLWQQFNLNEPWDSPTNKRILDTLPMPAVFKSPREQPGAHNKTYYQVITGPKTIWADEQIQPKLLRITDGTSNTFMIVEAKRPVYWTQPEDIVFNGKEVPALGGIFCDDFHVALADGSVQFVTRHRMSAQTLKALMTATGGEDIGKEWQGVFQD